MHALIHWFVHNPVASNLLMMILVVGGLLALPRTHQEEFPTLDVEAVSVRIPYLGAAPAEVESSVCIRVEEAVEADREVLRSVARRVTVEQDVVTSMRQLVG